MNDTREKGIVTGRSVLTCEDNPGANKSALHLFVAVHVLLRLTAAAPYLFEQFNLAKVDFILILVEMHEIVLGARQHFIERGHRCCGERRRVVLPYEERHKGGAQFRLARTLATENIQQGETFGGLLHNV